MPKAWTEAIEAERAAIAQARADIYRAIEEVRATVARLPPPIPPADPEPLIAPIRAQAAAAATAAEHAASLATQAKTRADQALSAPQSSPSDRVLTVFHVLAKVVAVRVLLFLALGGTFALALMAMREQSWMGMALVVSFAVLSIGPLAWLEVAGRGKAVEE